MTLKEAVQILKQHNHRGKSDWMIPDMQVKGPEPFRVVGKANYPLNLTAFEAIAIAEKYSFIGSNTGERAIASQDRAPGFLNEHNHSVPVIRHSGPGTTRLRNRPDPEPSVQ